MGGKGFQEQHKGHMDKTKDGVEPREGGGDGWGSGGAGAKKSMIKKVRWVPN